MRVERVSKFHLECGRMDTIPVFMFGWKGSYSTRRPEEGQIRGRIHLYALEEWESGVEGYKSWSLDFLVESSYLSTESPRGV